MPPKKKDSSTNEKASVKDMSSAFLSVLDNEEVITKLASILSTSINLILEEKLKPFNIKLDNIMNDNKALQKSVSDLEQSRDKLTQQNEGMQAAIDSLSTRVNKLEQLNRRNNLVITGMRNHMQNVLRRYKMMMKM